MTVEQAAARSTARIDVAYICCKGVFSGSAEVAAGLSSLLLQPLSAEETVVMQQLSRTVISDISVSHFATLPTHEAPFPQCGCANSRVPGPPCRGLYTSFLCCETSQEKKTPSRSGRFLYELHKLDLAGIGFF